MSRTAGSAFGSTARAGVIAALPAVGYLERWDFMRFVPLLALVLVGCTITVKSNLPHSIVFTAGGKPALQLEFMGDNRELTMRGPEGEEIQGRSTDYKLQIEVASDGAVPVAILNGGYVDFIPRWTDEKGRTHVFKPTIIADGKELDMVEAWKRYAKIDKRFVVVRDHDGRFSYSSKGVR